MFNRLPIYSRPKEPAIGEPVLTGSTNSRLTEAQSSRAGFDTYPPRSNRFENDKGLPRLPTPDLSYNDYLPPPRVDSLGSFSAFDSHPPRRVPSDNPALPHKTVVPPASSRKFNVNRKPAPSPIAIPPPPPPVSIQSDFRGYTTPSGYGTISTVTAGVGGLSVEQNRRNPSGGDFQPASNNSTAPKQSGFGFGNLVKEKVTGRRKHSLTSTEILQSGPSFPESDFEIPAHPVKPANSIDDWLGQREKLHKRSNTVSTVSTQYSRHNDPHKLHIRQSTFAPLHPPDELASDAPPLPPIPALPQEYRSSNASIPPRSTSLLGSQTGAPRVPSPPPPRHIVREMTNMPMDRISQLEVEQEKLETDRYELRKEIYKLQTVLPPNPSTHNPAMREKMKGQLEDMQQKLADVEKEIHETGLKLRRAIRRREKRDGYEGPTHLWVSRVTARDD